MSDEENSYTEPKRRRLQNACDECRKRKVKCDSALRSRNICSNCIALKMDCTHTHEKKKRGPRLGHHDRTIQETVDAILSTRRPFQIPDDQASVRKVLVDLANHIRDLEEDIAQLRRVTDSLTQSVNAMEQQTDRNDPLHWPTNSLGTYSVENLVEDLKTFEFDAKNVRHFGSSSNVTLMKAAMDIKKETYLQNRGEAVHEVQPGRSHRRPEFWTVYPWQQDLIVKNPPLEFPADDLMQDLMDCYFTNFNHVFPVLHRPLFLKSLRECAHVHSRQFGELVLAVCALGARFSNDPRVFEDTSIESSIGWKWIRQIQPLNRSFVEPPSVYEVQMFAIYISFMSSSSTPEISWILISVGVRLAQDVGAHRRPQESSEPTVESESWKRAFWLMYVMDLFASACLGRPRSIQDFSYDANLPIECDEEYWEHGGPELAFKQPPGEPSTMSYWNCLIKLMIILGNVLRTIYAVNQSELCSAAGMTRLEWSEKVVAELDSSLNNWTDEIPEHLKWDPNQNNREHFEQAVMLYANYYLIQILIHRPFIPGPGEQSVLSFPSLAICANAARLCLHVLEVHHQRGSSLLVFPQVMMGLFNSVLVLLVNTLRCRHSSSPIESGNELALIHRGIDMLRHCENRQGRCSFYDFRVWSQI
ncbi:hypothetical protein GYMLUDRAFT_47450 [Collybiopsis luxurians FD-317 M1]|uniref:Zn(2)-C6 fungal-type domain-containing protein n=1 Tax=Collybiopsis luxurians FD-317 M1 TaxID=944289 RepID=A0A0D0AZ17_9AGAR|nr:hypothetical protein GYMLUDRAFT_47450 [Collybiopsis luxurians FD-317 M1]